jgi:transposase-like protein DUF772
VTNGPNCGTSNVSAVQVACDRYSRRLAGHDGATHPFRVAVLLLSAWRIRFRRTILGLIDRHISFDFVRAKLKDSYRETGRPSIDPELLPRILPIGYLYGITSDRNLVESPRARRKRANWAVAPASTISSMPDFNYAIFCVFSLDGRDTFAENMGCF